MEYKSTSEKETSEIAGKILEQIILKQNQGPVFVGLVGDLGAGKTAFVKGVAKFFAIEKTINSPTFVIQKNYEITEENRSEKKHNFKQLLHLDMYRLEDEKELANIKWEDYKKDPSNIIFVEWPNQIWSKFPEEMIEIKIENPAEKGEENKRIILTKNLD